MPSSPNRNRPSGNRSSENRSSEKRSSGNPSSEKHSSENPSSGNRSSGNSSSGHSSDHDSDHRPTRDSSGRLPERNHGKKPTEGVPTKKSNPKPLDKNDGHTAGSKTTDSEAPAQSLFRSRERYFTMPKPEFDNFFDEGLEVSADEWAPNYYRARKRLMAHIFTANRTNVVKELKSDPTNSKLEPYEEQATQIIKAATVQASTEIPSNDSNCLKTLEAIEETSLYRITKDMPLAGLLHIHYNMLSNSRFLIKHAKKVPSMYIQSDLPLTSRNNMYMCRIQFKPMSDAEFKAGQELPDDEGRLYKGNLFDPKYKGFHHWMKYSEFLENFRMPEKEIHPNREIRERKAEDWLETKGRFEIDEIQKKKRPLNMDREIDPCK
jgi:hypothetical protein